MPRFASAQQWPAKPIRAIVPFGAGSTIDVIGRIVLEPLSAALGQPIVVENRGGAGGSIGSAAVAKA
ncbi:MAG TPA: tripartite tricarboxylate transporter substrate-binding protein, partial [Burkholderiales bacterium]|nr:tripartite tricarboxylate transporter substrate-binding protein [Burkholderiales bacterium]